MQMQEVAIKPNVRVILKSDSELLEEVVVTGYGTFKKASFTGAAATVNTSSLEDIPVLSVADKLSGSVAGVTFGSSSSNPGSVSSIRVRGMGSINAGNNPLYVIDGTPVTSGDISEFSYSDAGTDILSSLNTNDIESITVIKDAAAASLYGSRAANGVIVITTKSGKEGKTNVSFRSDWGASNMAIDYRPMHGGDARRELLWTGLKNQGLYSDKLSEAAATAFADKEIDNYASKPAAGWTDWKDLLFSTGSHQNYQLSVSGGNERTKFYTSLAYTKQDGIVFRQNLERFTGNANITHKFGDFDLQVTSQFSKVRQNKSNEGTSYDGAIANYAFFQSPSSTPYNADGSLNDGCGTFGVNPLFEKEHSKNVNTLTKTFNTIKLTYNIWDKLNLSEKIAYDYTQGTENSLWDKYSNNGGPGGVMQRIINKNEQLNTQTQLTYINSFGQHNVDGLLGFETQDTQYTFNYLSGSNYPGELYEFSNAGSTSAESNKQGYRMTSFLGRVNYNYADKYYLGGSYRSDGSSRLARENRWGSFWSVSGAWRFINEDFLGSIKHILTDGKLRMSYGVNGTQPSDYYAYMNLYKYGIKYGGQSGMSIVGIANPDLKWEKNKTWNIGLDLSFIDRIGVTLDFYQRKTTDLIYDLPVSQTGGYYNDEYGYTTPQNIGSLKNSGFELTITSTNFRTKDFTWTTSLNMSHNSNKLTKLDGQQNEIVSGPLIHRVGESYYSYYLYEYAGVDSETGKEMFYLNDGTDNARKTTTNISEAKKTIVGKHQATIEGGLTNNLKWKFIDLGFTFTYSLGGDAFDYATWQHSNGGSHLYNGALPTYYDLSEMWTGPGDTRATQPKFEYGSTASLSSRWIMPTDYLRLKNLTLGVSLPQQYAKKLNLNKARIYFSGSNLLTWKSDDLFVDPEMRVDGLCTFETPALRTFTFGIELNF
ncbi:SusC/RagA family TonB-linked outer membrane protein [Bacteroides sp. 51]|nr:SusC/RagA family TonB-linked outer membrane protein [Bacteroides sp. 51]